MDDFVFSGPSMDDVPVYTVDVMISDVLYKVLPETREVHVYDTDDGADDGVPSSMYTVARSDFAMTLSDLLQRGTLL